MKNAFKTWKEVWKAWFGIILIFIGLQITIIHSNYWMIFLCAIGLILFFNDWNKLKGSQSNQTIILATIITLGIMFSSDVINHFF